jgi:hypothetical protein
MNKFEALKMFQGWPPEWQRLCAEYWIETGEDRPAVSATASNLSQVWCHADQVELAKKLLEPVATLAHESVSTRLAQDKAAKVAATQGCTPIYRGEFGIIEREYLAKCHHETSTRRDAANMFLDRYPGRSVQAVEIKIRKMLDASGVMHVRY